MAAYNNEITEKAREGTLDQDEKERFKKWRKLLTHLSQDPRHPGLRSHEIEPLSQRFGQKVFQSYLDQSNTADRVFWTYGPDRGEITVLGIEPHPEHRKRGGYDRVKLSDVPPPSSP